MSINQLNNKKNIFFMKENTHNLMSTSFFLFAFLFSFVLVLLSSIEKIVPLIVFSVLFMIFCIIKIIFQIRSIFLLLKLEKSIDEHSISFYITKSWLRKKQATTWVGSMLLLMIFIFLITTIALINILSEFVLVSSIITLIVILFLVIIVLYVNSQIIEGYLKISRKKINLHTIEWTQIQKDQKFFYRLLFIWYINILLLVPLLFMILPKYRDFIYKIAGK